MSTAHRVTQVAAHLAAVAREWLLAPLGGAPAGAAGGQRLVDLGASRALRDLYARAHPADRAAATRLAAALRRAGGDADEEIAALLHDTAKGRTGLLARIVHVLEGSPHGGAARGPLGAQRQRLHEHATRVVTIAREAGASPRSVAILTDLAELEANGVVRSAGDGAAARLFLLDSGGHA